MSMYGSLKADYAAWKDGSSDAKSAEADGYEHTIREAFMAGAASAIGGACKARTEGKIDGFLDKYRKQINAEIWDLGIEVAE